MSSRTGSPWVTMLLWVQGLYYLATAVWPMVSIQTFQLITGQKTDNLPTGREGDHWLVMTVAVLILAIGLAILLTAWRRNCPPEMVLLAVASAAGLTAVDVIYVARHVILPIYLLDAAAEVILIGLWGITVIRGLRVDRAARVGGAENRVVAP